MQDSTHENIQNRNTKDIFMRNAALAVLDVLNREIFIELVRNDKIEKHSVPFFYNFGGDGQMMTDFFHDIPGGLKLPEHAEGNYETLPNGIVTINNFAIKSGDITNKFVRGTFTQEERGENDEKVMKAYSSRLFTLPMEIKFGIKIKSDNLNKTFKITEKIFDLYYKNLVTYFQYRGLRIPGQLKFPESMQNDKKYEFTYDTDKRVITNFELDLETYYPSFDDSSTRYKGNVIRQFNISKKIMGSNTTIADGYIDKDFPPTE
jgi:hypothetical protein